MQRTEPAISQAYVDIAKMKSNIDLVNECDCLSYDVEAHKEFYSFMTKGYSETFGYLLEKTVKTFTWPAGWTIDHEKKTLSLSGTTREEREEIVSSTIAAEKSRNTFRSLRKLSGEMFPIYGPNREIVLNMDRSATVLFGVVTYAVQLLVYEETENGIKIWIARRSKSKTNFPGLLDVTVGGGLATGESPFECMVREAEEEVAFPPTMTRKLATSCGTLSYVNISDERMGGEVGLIRPKVVFIFEMMLPSDIKPQADGEEVEDTFPVGVDELKLELATGQFAPTQACATLDFLIRHGVITSENEPHYVEIAQRLHRTHIFPTI